MKNGHILFWGKIYLVSKANDATILPSKKEKFQIGIPRALYFYKFGALWKAFLEKLGCDVVFSPPTTSSIVENGSKIALSELCVPMKIYFGHIQALLDEFPDLDYIFIPRYVSNHKKQFFCPKFLILPETIKYEMNIKKAIITLEINVKEKSEKESAIDFGKKLGYNEKDIKNAWEYAKEEYSKFKTRTKKMGYIQELNKLDKDPKHKLAEKNIKHKISKDIRGKYPLNITILGHAYNVYEQYININLIDRLKAMDCNVSTIEMLPDSEFEKPITINKQYHQYWQSEDEILKTARYCLTEGRKQLDGVIFLISFACGPDSLIEELVMRDMKSVKIPYLDLILDEHSGESGYVTRIESFIDMIRIDKYSNK